MSPKKILQDIVPGERRSIRSIPIRRAKEEYVEEENIDIEDEPVEEEEKNIRKPRRRKNDSNTGKSKYFLSFIIIFVCIAIIGIALSLLFTKGVVTVTPISKTLAVDGTITAKKNVVSDQLKYEIVTVNDTLSKEVPAKDGPLIQTKAKGKVVLYNNYSATAQKIVAGSRLSNSKGLIYKTTATVTIPGKKTISGKVSPGSITADIIAEQAGADYNTSLLDLTGDFKFIGYKGTDKYNGFYGRMKTDITGGFNGTKKIITDIDKKEAENELRSELKDKLLAKVVPLIPKDYVMFENANIFDYQILDSGSNKKDMTELSIKGTIYGIIFNKVNLLKNIAAKELRTFPTETYNTEGIDNLKFSISNIKDFSVKKETPLTFTLKGDVVLTGTFDEAILKSKLKGISLKDSSQVFKEFSSISNAYAIITPFWMRSFPNKTEYITIEYKYK